MSKASHKKTLDAFQIKTRPSSSMGGDKDGGGEAAAMFAVLIVF
jgi:hypothetical protein